MKKKGKSSKRNGKAKRKPAKRSKRAAPKMIPPNEMVDVGPSGRR
jgi:hypothetical protein